MRKSTRIDLAMLPEITRAIGIRGFIAIGLAIFLGITLMRVDHLKADNAVLEADLERVKAAQAEAELKQLAAKAEYERKSEKQAHEAEINEQAQKAEYDARLASYIAANRVRPKASGGPSGGPGPAEADAAIDGNGPGAGSLVFVGVSDLHICAANTARLQSVRTWGLGLIEQGLAE